MSVSRGKRIGPYEVLGLIGAGGMGEVYRARDPRLGRDVAIKVLPAAVCQDPDRLRRFEQEARAAGALNHPNILAVFDVGTEDHTPFIVSELLEGSTLRHLIGERPLPIFRALDYATQIARGLAAAHQKGILHRDLKPENLFVTRDGQAKILDFGLAKLKQADAGEDGSARDTLSATTPGTILGTVGYMAPEQVSGLPADHRSDLFSFGAVLYEMLTGRRAFKGETAVETMAAILKEDPPSISSLNPAVPPGLERLVGHCLEKRPEARCESARDLGFQLEGLSHPPMSGPTPRLQAWRLRRAALAGLAPLLFVSGVLVARGCPKAGASPEFRQLTFRRGEVLSARFSPDGHTILYSASWDGDPPEVFSTRLDSIEARSLGWRDTELLGVTRGEMAVLQGRNAQRLGTLARAPLDGSTAPRKVLTDVRDAAWSPNGEPLAVVCRSATGWRLELPPGTVLHETAGTIISPRVSPRGDRVAFIEQPVPEDTRGSVVVAERSGGTKIVSTGWSSVGGLAWSADARELWFTATKKGAAHALYKVTLDGRERFVARVAGNMVLEDISSDGRVLFTHAHGRIEARGWTPGDVRERDLSYMDTTNLADVSADGKKLLFTDSGEGGGQLYSVYLRDLEDDTVVRLGEGGASALSPDGNWAVSVLPTSPSQLSLLPTGAGQPLKLDRGTIADYQWAWWFPNGQRLLVMGNEPGGPSRLFVQGVPQGEPQPVGPLETPVSTTSKPLAPDGRFLGRCSPGQTSLCLFRPEDSAAEGDPVPGLEVGDQPLSWTPDGRFVFLRSRVPTGRVARIFRLDRRTGERTFLRELSVADPAGAKNIYRILLTPDGRHYAYQFYRSLDVLYLAEGLK